jgi:uncharacterized membrane protein YqiK
MGNYNEDRSSGGNAGSAIGASAGFIIGIAMMIGINFVPGVKPLAQMMVIGFGLFFTLICATLYVMNKLYIKTPANGAYVRTGMGGQKVIIDGGTLFVGGQKVIIDGGTLFVPVFHEKLFIPLETMKLDVIREGSEALTTQDREFFIKVNKAEEDVKIDVNNIFDAEGSKTVAEKVQATIPSWALVKEIEQTAKVANKESRGHQVDQ